MWGDQNDVLPDTRSDDNHDGRVLVLVEKMYTAFSIIRESMCISLCGGAGTLLFSLLHPVKSAAQSGLFLVVQRYIVVFRIACQHQG